MLKLLEQAVANICCATTSRLPSFNSILSKLPLFISSIAACDSMNSKRLVGTRIAFDGVARL